MPRKLDAVRFCVGPWKGRYSSVWRVWVDSDDVYLGVRHLVKYLKISLHRSGKFRAAFTDSYNQKLVEEGKDGRIDRAFLKWTKRPVLQDEIMQVLDLHFFLPALSLDQRPGTTRGKTCFIFQPHEESLEGNDTITAKILFHTRHPDSEAIGRALRKKNVLPWFWHELNSQEYMTMGFQYTKPALLDLPKGEFNASAIVWPEYFKNRGRRAGDTIENQTLMYFADGRPPSVYNVGGTSICWKSEKHFSITEPERRL